MKTNPEALKKLYVAMGGDEADVENLTVTPDVIEAIADIYEGGGGAGLPEVTSEDNGDVLTVVNGEWNKAETAKGVETISMSAADETAFKTAFGQFLSAALQASGAPTQTDAQVSLDIFDDVMTALDNGKAVIVTSSLGCGIVTQFKTGNSFVFRMCVLNYPVSAETSAHTDTVIYVNETAIGFYGYATLRS